MKSVVPILIVLLVLACLAFAAAVWIGTWVSGRPSQPAGVLLIYQIDSDDAPDPPPVDMDALVAAMDQRLNPGWTSLARVRQLQDGRIEVGVFGNDPRTVQRVRRALASVGTLEFRILANNRDHGELIGQAVGQQASVVRNEAGKVLGEWVPVKAGREASFQNHPEIATRNAKPGGPETLEILVAEDIHDVTGEYLKRAVPAVDGRGLPCVQLEFNSAGAKRFGGLTGSNLPGPAQGFARKLGVILNGRLYSAPAVQSTINRRGVITGSFSRQEAEDLAAVLNTGSLPAAIQLVETQVISPE